MGNKIAKSLLKDLAKQLVMLNVEKRKKFPFVRRPTPEAIKRCGLRFGQPTAPADLTQLSKRRDVAFVNILRTGR